MSCANLTILNAMLMRKCFPYISFFDLITSRYEKNSSQWTIESRQQLTHANYSQYNNQLHLTHHEMSVMIYLIKY